MDLTTPPDTLVDNYPGTKRSMRIAVVTETYPPEVNGVAMTIARMVEGLHQRHHSLQLIRPRQPHAEPPGQEACFDEVLMRGLPIPRYPNLRLGVPSKQILVRLWAKHRPDVVHIATEGPLGWSALSAARQLKLPVSSDYRTNFHAYSQHYGIGWLHRPIMAYLRNFHNRTMCTMVPTQALRRELEAVGFQRLAVVTRGVDTLQFSPRHRSEALRAAWGARPDDLVVVGIGRLAPEKNLNTLLAAYEAIGSVHARSKLVIVGDGPLRSQLQALCPAAIFAGQRTGDDLAAHYASADLFLFPSLTETFGNVTTEAMASGLPVIAFDYAAAAEVISSGYSGVLAPMSDPLAFTRSAVALAGDASLRRAMGERARLTACSLGWDSVIARFESSLGSVVRRSELAASAQVLVPCRPAA